MPKQKKIPIEGLLEGYEASLAQTGYSITTKLLLVRRAELMIRRHLNAGLEYFDQAVINRYVSEIDDKYFKGNMQNKHYERTKREIDRFVSYVYTGRIDALPSTLRGARQELTSKFKQIAEEFIAGDFHPNTRCDIRWVTYKYFAWLEEQGFRDIAGVGAIHIQKFLLATVPRITLPCSQTTNTTLLQWAVTSIGFIVTKERSTASTRLSFSYPIPRTLLAIRMPSGCLFVQISSFLMKKSWLITPTAGKSRLCSSSIKCTWASNPSWSALPWLLTAFLSFYPWRISS